MADDFDLLMFVRGVPRKRGRPPVIRSRGNAIGTFDERGDPSLSFDMGKEPTEAHDGSHLAPFRRSARNIEAILDKEAGTLTFSAAFGGGPKFVRGIHKIALSAFAYFHRHEVYDSSFNPIREFVRNGAGGRHALLIGDKDGAERHVFDPPIPNKYGGYCITFRVVCLRFFVNMSSEEQYLEEMADRALELYGKEGWTWLPQATTPQRFRS